MGESNRAATWKDAPSLTLVVPAFNESQRIREPLRTIFAYLEAQPYTSEVVVVDDGSTDDTFDVVRQASMESRIPLRAFRYDTNRGKGYAVKLGFELARGERILFSDADLSTPIDETNRLLERLESGFDLAIGSRKMEGAEILVHQKKTRESLGKAFTWIVRTFIAEVSDVTCGFKAFNRDAGKEIFRRVRVYDWSFDAEILLLADRLGYALSEVPVRWEDRAGTKVRLMRDVFGSLWGLLRIRSNSALGVYRSPNQAVLEGRTWDSAAAQRTPVSTPAG
jgi:dolichyl-phosphate beta-glucosyltransferase